MSCTHTGFESAPNEAPHFREIGLIGPFFFEDEEGRTATVNTDRYLQVLQRFWNSLGRNRNCMRDLQWFMQDGANPHVSDRSLQWLRERFQDRLISRRTEHIWAPNSPDLNPLDFFLWGFLKDRLYSETFETIEALKDAIRDEVTAVTRDMRVNVVQHFRRRVQTCFEANGGHIEHIL